MDVSRREFVRSVAAAGATLAMARRAVAEEVAADAYEQERREEFFQMKVAQGAGIQGVYPPNEQTLAEYAAWRKKEG